MACPGGHGVAPIPQLLDRGHCTAARHFQDRYACGIEEYGCLHVGPSLCITTFFRQSGVGKGIMCINVHVSGWQVNVYVCSEWVFFVLRPNMCQGRLLWKL